MLSSLAAKPAPVPLRVFSWRKWPLLASLLTLAGALLLTFLTTSADFRQVFAGPGEVHFVDADCYSRMTRVRSVCEHPGEIIREHDFENYPFGTRPHTTALFDYAVYALRLILLPFYGGRALDLAGAWISPLLGWLTVFGVWLWGERARLPGRQFGLLILAGSPFVAHGFALGRPDHQSLIMACMAYALAAEWRLWRGPSRRWGIVSGVAWAFGLWTSLYEPLILLALVVLAGLAGNRAVFRQRERWPGVAAGGGILLVALLVEGWRIGAPPGFGAGNGAEYFAAWSRQIGELASVPPWSPSLYAWTGLGLLAAPGLLALNRDVTERPIARANLFLLAVVFLLTCWQVRWAYFLPLVYALSLPWQFAALPARQRTVRLSSFILHVITLRAISRRLESSFILSTLLLLGLWPMANEWWTRLRPDPARDAGLSEQRTDATLLHEAARFIAQTTAQAPAESDPPVAGILAPWWLSPAAAYWSGQPAVAGSSHESLPGIVDAARFYVAADPRDAAAILRKRRVRWVVAYEPDRVLRTAASLFGQTQVSTRAMDLVLYHRPEAAPRFLRLVLVNPYFKIYEVQLGSLPP